MRRHGLQRRVGLLLATLFLVLPFFSAADAGFSQPRLLRVGYPAFDGYYIQDASGARSGYGYEYLQHLSVYGNWTYEYVGYDATWEEMFALLAAGEIDLLAPVLKTEARQEQFAFSAAPIGYSSAILTTRADDFRYAVDDYAGWNGIRVGLLSGGGRNARFAAYAAEKGFTYQSVYYDNVADLSVALLAGKKIDAILSTGLRTVTGERVLAEDDAQPFYFLLRTDDTELISELDAAMTQLSLNEPDLQEQLADKYYTRDSGSIAFTAAELAYLDAMQGQTLVALVAPDSAPFSSFSDGEAMGIVPEIAAQILSRTGLTVEIRQTDSQTAYRALLDEADLCLDMPENHSAAERAGYKLCPPYLSANIARVTTVGFSGKTSAVGVVAGSAVARLYTDAIPDDVRIVSYASTDEALLGLRRGRGTRYTCTSGLQSSGCGRTSQTGWCPPAYTGSRQPCALACARITARCCAPSWPRRPTA